MKKEKYIKWQYFANYFPVILILPVVAYSACQSTGGAQIMLGVETAILLAMALKVSLSLWGVGGFLSFKNFKKDMQLHVEEEKSFISERAMMTQEQKEQAQFMFLEGNHKKH